MLRTPMLITVALFVGSSSLPGAEEPGANLRAVTQTEGLVAFWDFDHSDNATWISYHDPALPVRPYPLHLKRIGDPRTYSMQTWPYRDTDSKIVFDDSGPFGCAVGFNKGYIYGAVERTDFDGTLLDLHGKYPFTLIAWVKFVGRRHMVAGIWDEGGWNKYSGRRQVALFAGLFGRKGVIAHISATGAASYPQSNARGSQYARCRAIDGRPFQNGQWVAMATTYDPDTNKLTAYLDGTMTPLAYTDEVAQDAYHYQQQQPANPFGFPHPIYSPRAFLLKFNGYSLAQEGISEHRLHVDLNNRLLTYEADGQTKHPGRIHRIIFDVLRGGQSVLPEPVELQAVPGRTARIPTETSIMTHDEIRTRLEVNDNGEWHQVGTTVTRQILDGAPFTFGRALGLGADELDHGSQLYLDGVAVFNRVLTDDELGKLSFTAGGQP